MVGWGRCLSYFLSWWYSLETVLYLDCNCSCCYGMEFGEFRSFSIFRESIRTSSELLYSF